MFRQSQPASMVTIVLPNAAARRVAVYLNKHRSISTLVSKARGTLLQESWWRQWLPPINPAKSTIQALLSADEVEPVVSEIVKLSNLDRQATGAVFSTHVEDTHIGSQFRLWRDRGKSAIQSAQHDMNETLTITYCIVSKTNSDRIARAAINAGAHGPIVANTEGRGLRDRLGWLRITKEQDKEVLMVISDKADSDEVFSAMASAGELHLPGRGFMYRMSIDKGLFNLPSRISNHRYEADMQQVIKAIDHLSGHTHWRGDSADEVGAGALSVGVNIPAAESIVLDEQVCMTAIVVRDQSDDLMDLMLDQGAPGVNVSYARFSGAEVEDAGVADAVITPEYAQLRCIAGRDTIERIAAVIDERAESEGLNDLCVQASPILKVATYKPGLTDYRDAENVAVA